MMKGGWGERGKEETHGEAKAIEEAALLQGPAAPSLPFLNMKATEPHWSHSNSAQSHPFQVVHSPGLQAHVHFVLFTVEWRFLKF